MFSIRKATEADYDQICAMYAQVDELHERAVPQVFTPAGGPSRPLGFILDAIRRDDNALLVAEEAGEQERGEKSKGLEQTNGPELAEPKARGVLVGFVHAMVNEVNGRPGWVARRYVYVSDLVVHENYRGRGVGRLLMDAVEGWAADLGINTLELTVWEFNSRARSMYEKLGYSDMYHRMWKQLP